MAIIVGSGPLFGLDPSRGMFRQYESPLFGLCSFTPIFGNELARGLIMDMHRRLRQLDRYLTEARECIDRIAANPPMVIQIEGNSLSGRLDSNIMECASDAAEIFYLFGFRVFDAARSVATIVCGKPKVCRDPKNFRNVRNHLLVHPESFPGQVLSWSADYSNKESCGIVLKFYRNGREIQGHKDAGIEPNAKELERYLREWITAVYVRIFPAVRLRRERPEAP